MHRLLVVDDERKIREMIAIALEQENREIILAESGEQALTLIKHQPPHLIIADVKMDGMSGVEFLEQVKASWPKTAVLLLTGYDDDALEQRARNLGASGIIHKPLTIPEVRQTINAVLANIPTS
jgi:DNA-binding response OmpR family regulator